MTSVRPKRPAPSRHGLLFGGDALYQILAELATRRGKEFTVKSLATNIDRTPEHTRSEIEKLIKLRVVAETGRKRKARVYAVTETSVSDTLLELQTALVRQLGKYKRPRAV